MSDDDSKSTEPAHPGNGFPDAAGGRRVPVAGGAGHPGFAAFWSDALGEFFAARPESRVLDIADGSGVIVESLGFAPGVKLENVSFVDRSQATVDVVKSRFPVVSGIVADAGHIPLESGSFDLITSQFGLDHAGASAIDEAVRLLAMGGHMMFLFHIHSGALHRECLAAMDALHQVRHANFFQLAENFLETGFAAVRGADRAPYDSAAKQLNPVIRQLESIMSQHGENVANGLIDYLYSAVQDIHGRIQYYEPEEVLSWLRTANAESSKYLERMESINRSALTMATIEELRRALINKGLPPSPAEPLLFEGSPLPFAWALQASSARLTQH